MQQSTSNQPIMDELTDDQLFSEFCEFPPDALDDGLHPMTSQDDAQRAEMLFYLVQQPELHLPSGHFEPESAWDNFSSHSDFSYPWIETSYDMNATGSQELNQTHRQPQLSGANEDAQDCQEASLPASLIDDNQHEAASKQSLYRCTHPGCVSKTLFKRQSDYNRHLKKHSTIKLYCLVEYCSRRDRRPFYRADKLCTHLSTVHTEDEPGECPYPGFSVTLPFILLRWHVQSHYFHRKNEDERVRVCQQIAVKYSHRVYVKCDIIRCKRIFPKLNELQNHLSHDHKLDQRRSHAALIRNMGFEFHTTKVLCPICSADFSKQEDFFSHFKSEHMTSDFDHWEHFEISCREKGMLESSLDHKSYPKSYWAPWTSYIKRWEPAADFDCSFCGQPAMDDRKITHHLQLLNLSEEMHKHRLVLLRLLPEFQEHPIFNDVLPTNDKGQRSYCSYF